MAEALAGFQAAFAAALSGRGQIPAALRAKPGSPPVAKRFDVYRNNVHASLINALEAAFPAVERLVGREFFRAMSRVYLEGGLPVRGTLIGYGEGFADFLDGFEPARGLPYLGDVARLELLWLEAYHAADAAALTAEDFSIIAPDRLAATRPVLHPSLRLLGSAYPVVEIWRTNREDETVKPVRLDAGGEALVLLRPDAEVRLYRLPPGGLAFVKALQAGATFGAAAEALSGAADFELAGLLKNLIAWGAFAALDLESFIVSRKQ
jgi:hypothetical protein